MRTSDIEIEKQRADEELAGFLHSLVVEPVDQKCREALQEELFQLKADIEDDFKKKIAPLSKARGVEEGLKVLRDDLERSSNQLRAQGAGIAQKVDSYSAAVQGVLEVNQSGLDMLGNKLDSSRQRWDAFERDIERQVSTLQLQVRSSENGLNQCIQQYAANAENGFRDAVAKLQCGIDGLHDQSRGAAAIFLALQQSLSEQKQIMVAQQAEVKALRRAIGIAAGLILLVGLAVLVATTSVALKMSPF